MFLILKLKKLVKRERLRNARGQHVKIRHIVFVKQDAH